MDWLHPAGRAIDPVTKLEYLPIEPSRSDIDRWYGGKKRCSVCGGKAETIDGYNFITKNNLKYPEDLEYIEIFVPEDKRCRITERECGINLYPLCDSCAARVHARRLQDAVKFAEKWFKSCGLYYRLKYRK